jgi:Ca2+-binding RTX toxin-like protein
MLSHRHLRAVALAVASAALALPAAAHAASTCSYDVANATVHAQMLSPRAVIANAGDGRILVDGRVCAAPEDGALVATVAATKQVVVSSAFPPAADLVVVDESRGRLADAATGNRPKVFALTGTGGDTMEVIGTPGRDRYVAHDDLGASIDLDGDADPDFVSTDVARVVMFGKAGDDFLSAGAGPGDRMSRPVALYGGAGNDVLRGGRSGEDRLRP